MDFSRLNTPPAHGDTLVEPTAPLLGELTRANHRRLADLPFRILDLPADEVRRRARRTVGIEDDRLAIVTGHQPEFLHPGVWAKHVVSDRLSGALEGRAVNLVVDCDAPHDTRLAVPAERPGGLEIAHVPCAVAPAGVALETINRLGAEPLDRFGREVRAVFGDRFDRSMMPVYLDRLGHDDSGSDWVGQSVYARRGVERQLGVHVRDVRVSASWGGPLLAEMLIHGARFAAAYNRALADYRRRHRVRSPQRPIPDLVVEPDRVEVPAWVYRRGIPRSRLFVGRDDDAIVLLAGDQSLGTLERRALERWDTAAVALTTLDGVLIRPRALALTLWARLFVADLFVHGIGGAKYDRITDALIRDYFGVEPPSMACVSATLFLDLPRPDRPAAAVREARRRLRDLRYNPQRYVERTGGVNALIREREEAVALAASLRRERPREAGSRRRAFHTIRKLNRQIAERQPQLSARFTDQVRENESLAKADAVARRRDYFFALFPPQTLEMLIDQLPGQGDFGL